MLKVKHERECDCVVAGFRWHRGEKAAAVGFLASDLSGCTTGSIVTIDAGLEPPLRPLAVLLARRIPTKANAAASKARLDGSGTGEMAANSPCISPAIPSAK
jgi:hypothetical protein